MRKGLLQDGTIWGIFGILADLGERRPFVLLKISDGKIFRNCQFGGGGMSESPPRYANLWAHLISRKGFQKPPCQKMFIAAVFFVLPRFFFFFPGAPPGTSKFFVFETPKNDPPNVRLPRHPWQFSQIREDSGNYINIGTSEPNPLQTSQKFSGDWQNNKYRRKLFAHVFTCK